MENNFVNGLILFSCIYLLYTVMKLNSRVKGLEYTLEQISKQVDVPENPINNELPRHQA